MLNCWSFFHPEGFVGSVPKAMPGCRKRWLSITVSGRSELAKVRTLPSSRQKFKPLSGYVFLQVGQISSNFPDLMVTGTNNPQYYSLFFCNGYNAGRTSKVPSVRYERPRSSAFRTDRRILCLEEMNRRIYGKYVLLALVGGGKALVPG